MRDFFKQTGFCLLGLIALGVVALPEISAGPTSAASKEPDAAGTEYFETKIRPLLVANCASCHGAAKQEAGLRLDTRKGFLNGSDGTPIVSGNEPAKSRLMQVLSYDGDTKMPPAGKLSGGEIAKISAWIKMGSPWPDTLASSSGTSTAPAFDLAKRKAAHWAWKPIQQVAPPKTKDAKWPRAPLDNFILARLEQAGLKPALAADSRTLIRRAYFDVVGLPPSPAEVEAFVADKAADAYEKVVDRLLASPHFGEKWARHWMDLMRYAETRGHEFDYDIPNAWQYRDYLIRAYNADVPYDQFLTEHLAGDLMEKPRTNPADGSNESVLGTGFWFLGEEVHSPVDIRQDETDRMANRADTVSKAFLGLTVACARCHDHKFDAISQKDYYALNGFLLSGAYRQTCFQTSITNRKIAEQLADLSRRAGSDLLQQDAVIERPTVARISDYLIAAREAISTGHPHGTAIHKPLPGLTAIAEKDHLDAAMLEAWIHALQTAKHSPHDLLHAFAAIAGDAAADDSKHFAERLKDLIAPPAALPPTVQVVVDYSKAGQAKAGAVPWYADGFAFGLRPARAGDVVLGDNAQQPIAEIVSHGAARRDPAFNGLRPIEGAEVDPGELGQWQRPGRVVRTPKVTLQSGKLFYLARGSGRAYAAVDSHLIVVGPLHGHTLKEWENEGSDWRWVLHDLTAYKGQRVEVEFSPKSADGDLAIAMVVEADETPPLPWQPNALLAARLAATTVNSPATMAKAYQHVFEQVSRAMEDGQIAADPRAAAATAEDATIAEVANWMVRNLDLFVPPHSPARQQLSATADSYIQRRAALIKEIRCVSQTAPAMFEGNGVNENLLKRGSPKLAEAEVPRRFLEALGGAVPGGYGPGSGRMELARQMLARDNPFTPRVMVNRIWYQLFGTGIVPTVDNFGVLGQLPSHPELLDYLAEDFRTSGWSVKGMIRKIMLSSTYRMSSQVDAHAEELDPQNILLHRMPVRRLPGEAIRDAILSVSGRLNPTMLGPSVEDHFTSFLTGRGRPHDNGLLDGDGRRSIYLKIRRNFLSPMMSAYDMPVPFAAVGRRNVSNVPAQALILMNDPFVVEQARLWATRVLAVRDQTIEARIAGMYLTAFARPPTAQETDAAVAFLDGIGETYGVPIIARRAHEQSWADLAHVLFNVKEFIFIR